MHGIKTLRRRVKEALDSVSLLESTTEWILHSTIAYRPCSRRSKTPRRRTSLADDAHAGSAAHGTSAATVHADLNGLLFTTYLLASVHPNSDDFDTG